jgi:molybdenum cofactor cytidylyltransferase
MFRLAAEQAALGRRVVTTMTTRIFAGQMALAPACLAAEDEGALFARLPGLLREHGHVLVAGSTDVEADKVAGISPGLVDRLGALADVDCVIVEADGSRRLPLKAPAEHEPVIPQGCTLVVSMAGLDALGAPIAAGYVHRPERVAALAGVAVGDPVTPAVIARVLAHPEGGARNAPAGARLVPFLNKADDHTLLPAAREIARLLLAEPRVDSVAIGATAADDPARGVWARVAAVVLAAGEARRFGSLKQVLPWQGRPLVAHVVAQALACPDIDRVAVTVGAGGEEVETALAGLAVHAVPVPDWQAGQSRSVQAGLSAATGLPAGSLGAVVFLLADQPGVTPALLSALVARHRETLAPVVVPRYQGRRGNPVLFDRSTFAEFASLKGDIGARPVLQAHADEIAWLDWPTPDVVADIDTAADYEALLP